MRIPTPPDTGAALPVQQVAVVVTDLDAAVAHWAGERGVGPWRVWTLGPPRLQDCTLRGEAVEFSLRHALAWCGDVQFELVQPLSGPSIFAEHLERHGSGVVHHVGAYVGDLDEHAAAVADHVRRGWTLLQSARGFGIDGDGAFAYLDPPGGHGPVTELISAPERRAEPEAVREARSRSGAAGTPQGPRP